MLYGRMVKGKGKHLKEKYAEKIDTIFKLMCAFSEAEESGKADIDELSGLFGQVMAQIMVYKEDEWTDNLGRLGFYLGKFIYLLGLFLFFVMKLYWLDFLCNAQIFAKKLELGTAISAEDWKIRNSCGYSINKEPLKSFCKINMKIDMEKYQTPEEAKKYLAELRKTQADKFIAIDKLLKLKPQRIAYNWVAPGETVADMLLPDLECFLTAAHLRILEIRANGADKNVVARCNQDLLQFRKWCLHNETLIGKLVAGAVDNRRLYALSYAMASGVYSKEEIIKLIGEAPDWSKQYSEVFASEHAMTEDFVNCLENASAEDIQSLEISSVPKTFWKFYQKFAPLFVKTNIKRDYLFTLNYYLKINSLLYRNDLSGLETLTNLQKCYIAGRGISDISEVRNCQKIVFLGLRGTTQDADYSVLLELPELDVLEIDSGVLPEDIKNELLEKGITVHEY